LIVTIYFIYKKPRKLKIWDRAQRESVWRRKFDWGIQKVEIPSVAKSYGPNSIASAYTQNAYCRLRAGKP